MLSRLAVLFLSAVLGLTILVQVPVLAGVRTDEGENHQVARNEPPQGSEIGPSPSNSPGWDWWNPFAKNSPNGNPLNPAQPNVKAQPEPGSDSVNRANSAGERLENSQKSGKSQA